MNVSFCLMFKGQRETEMRRATPVVMMICAFVLLSAPAVPAERTAAAMSDSKLDSVLGRDVTTAREGDGGRIVDLLVDEKGQVRAAVVEFGGFLGIGTRKIAVDWAAFSFSQSTISVAVSRDQLRTASEFKPSEAPFVVKPIQK